MESFHCHRFEPGMLHWHCVSKQNHLPSHWFSQHDSDACSLHYHFTRHSCMCMVRRVQSKDTCSVKDSATCGIFLWLRGPHEPLTPVQRSGDLSGCQGDDHTRYHPHPNLLLPEANVSHCAADHSRCQDNDMETWHCMQWMGGGGLFYGILQLWISWNSGRARALVTLVHFRPQILNSRIHTVLSHCHVHLALMYL